MKKNLLEYIMADSDRQITGIGKAAEDHGQMSTVVGNSKSMSKSGSLNARPQIPFEIDNIIRDTGDMVEKTIKMRNDFEKALENPSITKPQKMALKKSIDSLHLINSFLLKELPRYLQMFD